MKITRMLSLTGLLSCAVTLAMPAWADQYPQTRAIEWVVPYPAGGGTDLVARTVGEGLSKSLGQNVIISNKPGAATAIGADYAARAKADGYVILTGDTATLAANPSLYPKLSYQPERDFDSVGLLARFPMILVVNPSVPANTFAEFLEWAKTQKDGVSYATPGAGSPHHLAMELLRSRTGANFVHVPYRGAAPAVQDVVGGQVPFMFVDTASGMQYINGGRLRALGVASDKRPEAVANVPTLIELGLPEFEAYAWQGVVVPKGTPKPVIEKINGALQTTLTSPEVLERFKAMGLEAIPSTPEAMEKYSREEQAKWATVIRESGIKVD
jgi:tripartite-type tricarboxylate transporter receptor subunit TctC